MNLVYCDDSREGGALTVMCAVVLNEDMVHDCEKFLAIVREYRVPEALREGFEFHASALFHGKTPFEAIQREAALEIFRAAAVVVTSRQVTPIFYGAVNIQSLKNGPFASADPTDIAFRGCLDGIQQWMADAGEFAEPLMFICDDDTTNHNLKKQLRESYHRYRGRVVGNDFHADHGLAGHLHDDMYFGDSQYSVGLQLADLCGYIILRHLQGRQDTEFLYDMIRESIYHGVCQPEAVMSPQEKFQSMKRPDAV